MSLRLSHLGTFDVVHRDFPGKVRKVFLTLIVDSEFPHP